MVVPGILQELVRGSSAMPCGCLTNKHKEHRELGPWCAGHGHLVGREHVMRVVLAYLTQVSVSIDDLATRKNVVRACVAWICWYKTKNGSKIPDGMLVDGSWLMLLRATGETLGVPAEAPASIQLSVHSLQLHARSATTLDATLVRTTSASMCPNRPPASVLDSS